MAAWYLERVHRVHVRLSQWDDTMDKCRSAIELLGSALERLHATQACTTNQRWVSQQFQPLQLNNS